MIDSCGNVGIVSMPFGWFSGSGKTESVPAPQTSDGLKNSLNPEGIKPCCACPVTKRKRDDCFMNSPNGEVECKDLIDAHRECMAGFGFKV